MEADEVAAVGGDRVLGEPALEREVLEEALDQSRIRVLHAASAAAARRRVGGAPLLLRRLGLERREETVVHVGGLEALGSEAVRWRTRAPSADSGAPARAADRAVRAPRSSATSSPVAADSR